MTTKTKTKATGVWSEVWAQVSHFGKDAIEGVGIALCIGAAAVGLALLVAKLKDWHVDGFTIGLLEFAVHAILVTDVMLLVTYLLGKAVKAVRALREILK